MMKIYSIPILVITCLVSMTGCYKTANQEPLANDPVARARQYFESNVQAADILNNDNNYFTAATRQLDWQHAAIKKDADLESIWVPVLYPASQFISISLDPHRLFNINYIQQFRIWTDENALFHSELVSFFPDSNYVHRKNKFSGIVLVQDWQGHFIKEYKLEQSGHIKKMAPFALLERSANNGSSAMMIQLCYSTAGYNYSEGVDPVYWELSLGCEVYTLEDGGHSTEIVDANYYWNSGGGGGNGNPEPPTVPNTTITAGNNIIGNIKDYTKCFDNIAGYGQHYSVTLCVAQPVPGTRAPWGFAGALPSGGSTDLVSAGHAFLILNQWDMIGRVTRNIGFYPANNASPISPTDKGQLNNDDQHNYNISLTIEMDNSQFFTMLDFISHANDPGYNYDLNSNNCSTFAIRALRSTGINLSFTSGSWPGGGGFNPGDLGEDIRGMSLQTGMTKSTEQNSHPNWGICY